jgi:glycosyltransferase involved in cell wall biosynthesis
MPGMIARSIVIPIGSNIPAGRPAVRDNHSICYFGLLMPGKGVEEFLALAERLRAGAPGAWRAVLIGAAAEGAQAYAENVLSQAKALGVALHVGLGAADVADVLQTMQYAYLPGPGGITERRGAVLAALENGVRILGPVSGRTPEWLAARVIAANNPDAAYDALMRGRFSALAATEVLAATAWSAIAARHVELYEDMLRRKQP